MFIRTPMHLRPITVLQSQRGGIMDLFRTPPPAAQPPAQSPAPAQSTQTAPNGVVPEQTPAQVDPNVPQASPLDKHKDVWNTPPTPAEKPIFDGLDPAKVRETLSKQNLVGNIVTPEVAAKIAAGGEGAVQAFSESLNKLGQEVMSSQTLATTSIVEAALAKQAERFKAQLPDIVKRLSATDGLITENPLLNNPVVKPIAEALQDSFARKNPNATASELRTQVMDVLNALGTTFAPKPAETPAAKAAKAGEFDWGKFLDVEGIK